MLFQRPRTCWREAFCRLKADGRLSRLKLRLAGGMLADDKPLERQIRRRLARAGALGDVEFLPHMELPAPRSSCGS